MVPTPTSPLVMKTPGGGGGVKLSQSTQMKVYYLTFTAAAAASEGVPVNTGATEKRKPCLTYFNILLMVTSI